MPSPAINQLENQKIQKAVGGDASIEIEAHYLT